MEHSTVTLRFAFSYVINQMNVILGNNSGRHAFNDGSKGPATGPTSDTTYRLVSVSASNKPYELSSAPIDETNKSIQWFDIGSNFNFVDWCPRQFMLFVECADKCQMVLPTYRLGTGSVAAPSPKTTRQGRPAALQSRSCRQLVSLPHRELQC